MGGDRRICTHNPRFEFGFRTGRGGHGRNNRVVRVKTHNNVHVFGSSRTFYRCDDIVSGFGLRNNNCVRVLFLPGRPATCFQPKLIELKLLFTRLAPVPSACANLTVFTLATLITKPIALKQTSSPRQLVFQYVWDIREKIQRSL